MYLPRSKLLCTVSCQSQAGVEKKRAFSAVLLSVFNEEMFSSVLMTLQLWPAIVRKLAAASCFPQKGALTALGIVCAAKNRFKIGAFQDGCAGIPT